MTIRTPTDKDEEVVATQDPPVDEEPYLTPDDPEVQEALNDVLRKNATVLRIGGIRRKC